MDKKEKKYTLKNVTAEIAKETEAKNAKEAQIEKLKGEVKVHIKNIKSLNAIYKELNQADMQTKIADAWFKDGTMSPEQIAMFLELSKRIAPDIAKLDMNEVVGFIKEMAASAPDTEAVVTETSDSKVDTNINLADGTTERNA